MYHRIAKKYYCYKVKIKPGAPQGIALYDHRGQPWTVGASMDTTFKIDTALNLDCDHIFDIILVSDTKQMSRSYKSIAQYCAIKDFFFKLFNPPFFLQLVQNLTFYYTLFTSSVREVNPNKPNIICEMFLNYFPYTAFKSSYLSIDQKNLVSPFFNPNSKTFWAITPQSQY